MKGLETLGERARYVMRVSDVKFEDVTQLTGKSQSTISTYLSNRTYPSEVFFFALKKLIPNLNFHWLITGEGEMYLGESSPSLGTEKEKKLQHEIEDLKSTQAQLLKAVSALSSVIPGQAPKESGRSFKPGVRETCRRTVNLIEKYTAAHTPLVAEVATA